MARTQGIDSQNPIIIENELELDDAAKKIAKILLHTVAVAYLQIGSVGGSRFDIDYSKPEKGVVVSPLSVVKPFQTTRVRQILEQYLSADKVDRPEEVDFNSL